jgi:CheY-like chemotaxis protein
MNPTVFVVGNDEFFAKFLAVSLRGGGYTLAGVAPSGEEALHQIRALPPDLVLMDMSLSGKLDGVDTAEYIRTENGLPLIFLTANDDQSLLHRAKYTNPFGYLAKPFRQQDLVSAIEIALHRHRIEHKLKQREAWLATTLRCAGEGMIVTDSTGHIQLINEIAKRILGYSRDGGHWAKVFRGCVFKKQVDRRSGGRSHTNSPYCKAARWISETI